MNNDIREWFCQCGWVWNSEDPICPACFKIGYEIVKDDILDAKDILSIDEVLEEIEGRDEPFNEPT